MPPADFEDDRDTSGDNDDAGASEPHHASAGLREVLVVAHDRRVQLTFASSSTACGFFS